MLDMDQKLVVLQLKLESKGKTLGSYPFYLDRKTVNPNTNVLQVDPYSKVTATIIGNYSGGSEPYFELSAGFDPDVFFFSQPITNGEVEQS